MGLLQKGAVFSKSELSVQWEEGQRQTDRGTALGSLPEKVVWGGGTHTGESPRKEDEGLEGHEAI